MTDNVPRYAYPLLGFGSNKPGRFIIARHTWKLDLYIPDIVALGSLEECYSVIEDVRSRSKKVEFLYIINVKLKEPPL